jgi:XTP/dITP diphosphohydrolase
MTRRLARGERLVIATHNAGKLREIAGLLAPYGIDAVSAGSLGLPEPEETEPDFVGNARLKAVAAATASGLPALADDSGVCVAALGGAPGIYTARWAGPERDFSKAMERVHRALGDAEDRSGYFACVLCVRWPDGEEAVFEGRSDGTLVWPPRGQRGFGFDPMFQPAGDTRTYGEMSPDEKHATNHRARAFAKFKEACLPTAG